MRKRLEVVRALARGGSTPSAEEAERFFAIRVSDYTRALALFFGGLYLVGAVATLELMPERFWAVHLHPAKLAMLGLVLLCTVMAYLGRKPNCPAWLLVGSDLLLPCGLGVVEGLIAQSAPAISGLYLFPLLLSALVLILRAALIPSSAIRTAAVGFAAMGPVAWACWRLAEQDPHWPAQFPRWVVAIASTAWGVALSLTTALVSRVIYGLHREIAQARRLGQYELGELIGEGGMGQVYRAQHAMLRRPTAVKLLLPERAGPENIARFEREVQLTARLTHPNTVAIYDYGHTPDGVFYYAMEYLDGVSLEQLVRRFGAQPSGRVVRILSQAAAALAEAHALGLIHRDIKPANILFCQRGGVPDVVKLVDFGLVKTIGQGQGPELTQADAITGTPQYLAPESIVTPDAIDHRVDIYGLGAVGYFLLAGRPPFEGANLLEVCAHHLHTPPTPPSQYAPAGVLPELEALLLRCLAKSPTDRPPNAETLQNELLALYERAPFSLAQARSFWEEFRRGAPDALPDPIASTVPRVWHAHLSEHG